MQGRQPEQGTTRNTHRVHAVHASQKRSTAYCKHRPTMVCQSPAEPLTESTLCTLDSSEAPLLRTTMLLPEAVGSRNQPPAPLAVASVAALQSKGGVAREGAEWGGVQSRWQVGVKRRWQMWQLWSLCSS